MSRRISVVIEKDENGYYAYAPELKGCQTQGQTLDETMFNIKEAVEVYLETLDSDEQIELSSTDIITTSIEVPVA